MNESLIAPEQDTEFQENQTREHVRPPTMFKGKELAPYSRGTRILYRMICDDADLVIYRVLAFIYIHSLSRSEAVKLCWGNVNDFREKVLEFRETLTDQDEDDAQKLVDELLAAENATRVTAIPEDEGGKKKENKPGRCRPSSPGSK